MEEIIKPIGFFIENGNIVVANPCQIPIKMMQDAIKKLKKNKKGVTAVCFIQIPIPFKLRTSTSISNKKDKIKEAKE